MKSPLLLGGVACALLGLAAPEAHAQTASSPSAAQVEPSTSPAWTPGAPAPRETEASRPGDGVHFGMLGGVGFPRPLAVEALLEFDRLIALGVEYSALPTTSFSGVQTRLWALAADLRVFPFRNAFFIGLRAGKQHLSERASLTSGTTMVSALDTADTTFVNPRIGFLWNWHALALGIDAGVQIPLLSRSASTLPVGVSAPSGAADVSRTLGQDAIPTVDLLQIGLVM